MVCSWKTLAAEEARVALLCRRARAFYCVDTERVQRRIGVGYSQTQVPSSGVLIAAQAGQRAWASPAHPALPWPRQKMLARMGVCCCLWMLKAVCGNAVSVATCAGSDESLPVIVIWDEAATLC